PLQPDGSIEAIFQIGTSSQRGWRVARHQVRLAGQTARACGVVLMPATDAGAAVVIILPLAMTRPGTGARRFTQAVADRLTPLFRRLRQQRPNATFYYLGADGDADADRL